MFSLLKRWFRIISRKRNLKESKSLDTKLDRCLSTYQLIFYGISHMVGAGIYVLTGHIIKERVGPATNMSFLLSGFVSIFTGLCYCEFATLIPKAGSCYTYTYLMLGELPAFIIGWTLSLDIIISLASVAKGFSGALDLMINGAIRNFTETYVPLTKNSDIWESSVDLVALVLLFVLFLVTLTGANMSMNINSILAVLQICLLTTIIIACFVYGNVHNYQADGGYLPFGAMSIFQGAGITIFAYSGFESLSNSAEETKDPRKSIPIAMFTSLGIIIILYFLSSSGLSYMVPRLQIDERAPFIAAFNTEKLLPFKYITGIATLLATGATKIAVIYVLPRIFYAMAEDGLIFSFLADVNNRTKVPLSGLIVGIVFAITLAIFVKIQILADITSMGIMISFMIIGIDLIILRYLHSDTNDQDQDVEETTMEMRISIHPLFHNRKAFKIIFLFFILSIIFMGLSLIFIYPLSNIIGMIFFGVSSTFGLVFLIILSLYKPHSANDSFVTPWMPITPIITISLNICLLINLPGNTWIRFLIWLGIGMPIYILYGVKHSKLSYKDEEEKKLLKMNEQLSDETVDKMK